MKRIDVRNLTAAATTSLLGLGATLPLLLIAASRVRMTLDARPRIFARI